MPKNEEIDKERQTKRKNSVEDLKNGNYNSMQERVEYIEKVLFRNR